jgi:hypothetical protein
MDLGLRGVGTELPPLKARDPIGTKRLEILIDLLNKQTG